MAKAADPARSAADFLPPKRTLQALTGASRDCRGCDLYAGATQTVFGEGPAGAEIMLIGEQPGDREDVLGHPFVGPAGRLLDRALEATGIDRTTVYVTNAVKHFKFEPRGKRRITRNRTPRRSAHAIPGWKPSWPPSSRRSSSAWARPPPKP